MKSNKRAVCLSTAFGFYTAFCWCVGSQIGAEAAKKNGIGFGIWFLAVMLLTTVLALLIWKYGAPGCKRLWKKDHFSKFRQPIEKLDNIQISMPVIMFLLLLMWLPAYLGIFPGAYAYDSPTQLEQFRSGQLTTHHPVLHTLLLGLCLDKIGGIFHSFNVGIAVYAVLQMSFMAAVLAFSIVYLRRRGVPGWFRGLAIIYFGVSPTIQMFMNSTTKDVYFSGVFFLFLLCLLELGGSGEAFFGKRSNIVWLVLSGFGTMVLRNNGLYVVLALFVIALIATDRDVKKKLLLPLGILAAMYFVYAIPFCKALGVEKGGVQEMLSVPLQQMARTYVYHAGELKPEDCMLLEELVPVENLYGYVPTVADNVKNYFNEEVFRRKPMEFLKLWLRWGVKYPVVYVESFLINTVDFWYPQAIVDGYNPGLPTTDFFHYRVGEPGKRVNLMPRVYDFYKKISIDRAVQSRPLMFMLLSPGWYLLLVIWGSVTVWYKKKKDFALFCVALLLAEATVLLGPIAQVRYVLILYLVVPVLFGMFLQKKLDFQQ